MSIRTLNRIFYLTNAGMVSLAAVFAVLLFLEQRELKHRQEVHYESHLLADELRKTSDDLTRLARAYVTTSDPQFESMYWQTLAIRNGKALRPSHYERVYRNTVAGNPTLRSEQPTAGISFNTLMKRLGSPSAEFAKLEAAESKSNELVQAELVAFNAMKGFFRDSTGQFKLKSNPDTEFARRILHDDKYHQAKKQSLSQ